MKTKEDIKSILDELLHKLIELRDRIENCEDKNSILDWVYKERIDDGICWYLFKLYNISIYIHRVILFGRGGYLGRCSNVVIIKSDCDLTPLNLRIQWLQNVTDSQIDTILKCANK